MTTPFSYTLQSLDTEIFGFKTAKISSIENSDDETVKRLIQDLQKHEIAYATYRFDAADFSLIHSLERNRFLLVDGIITLELSHPQIVSFSRSIAVATKEDIPELKNITKDIFSGTRFFNDPLIPKNSAQEIYIKWIENSVNGQAADLVFIYKENNAIVGFVTLQKEGHIPLIGVKADTRGKGMGKELLHAAINQCKEWDVKTIEIETQTTNIAALRAYTSVGFKITGSQVTYRWSNRTE